VRTKRKYEKKPKIPPLSAPQHSGPSVFNPKDLNQYDFPSSDEEPFSQVGRDRSLRRRPSCKDRVRSRVFPHLVFLRRVQIHSGSSEAEEENDPDGCYAFRRKAGCQYYAVSALLVVLTVMENLEKSWNFKISRPGKVLDKNETSKPLEKVMGICYIHMLIYTV